MAEDSKVKKYPLRKKPLKPTNREWLCVCGHQRYDHLHPTSNSLWDSDYNYKKCTICICPGYKPDEKGGRWGV